MNAHINPLQAEVAQDSLIQAAPTHTSQKSGSQVLQLPPRAGTTHTTATAEHHSRFEINGDAQAETPYIEHWVLQFKGVAAELMNSPEGLEERLSNMVARLGLTEVSAHSHYFGPGVSTVIILSESHLSAHTWPETGYMHVDIVTCVEKLTPALLEREARVAFAPTELHMAELRY